MMRPWKRICAGLLVTAACWAQDNPWHITAGIAYRDFDEVNLKPFGLRNTYTMCEPGGPFGIQNHSVLPGLADGSGVTADLVMFSGMNDAPGGEWGPTLGIQRDIYRNGAFTLRLTGSIAYFNLDTSVGTTGSDSDTGRFFATHYNYLVADEQVLAPPINDKPLEGFSPGTSATVQLSSFDMDTIVADVGLRAQVALKRCYLMASAGPALYWIDAESEITESGQWNAIPGTGDPGQYRMARRDSNSETEIGLYASVGASLEITDRINLEAAVRWDDAFDEVGTAHTAVDLDGVSAQLKVMVDF